MLFSFSKEINYTNLKTINSRAHFIFTAQKKEIIFFELGRILSGSNQIKRTQMCLIAGPEKRLSKLFSQIGYDQSQCNLYRTDELTLISIVKKSFLIKTKNLHA